MPPLAAIALVDGKVGGVPVPLLYVFSVWAILIAGAAALARPLRNSEHTTASSGSPGAPD